MTSNIITGEILYDDGLCNIAAPLLVAIVMNYRWDNNQ